MKITLGKAADRVVAGCARARGSVTLDLALLLSTRMLLTADSGGGKTFALKRLCEQIFGKVQILIVDPEGEFSPLAGETKVTTKVVTDDKLVRAAVHAAVMKLSQAYAAHFRKTAEAFERLRKGMRAAQGNLRETLERTSAMLPVLPAEPGGILEIKRTFTQVGTGTIKQGSTHPVLAAQPVSRAPARLARPIPANGEPAELTPQQRNILAGLAEFEGLGRTPVPRSWVGAAAGQSFKSSTFEKYVARLKFLGLIEYAPGQRVGLTEEGRRIAPPVDAALDTDEIQRRALALLTPQQQALLRALIAEHPQAVSREQLGERAGQSHLSSTFEKYVAALRSAGMVEYGPQRMVRCADWLFID